MGAKCCSSDVKDLDLKLTYFDAYGRTEAIRLLLNHAGAGYEEVRVAFSDWMALKNDKTKVPYGSLPVLEIDGKVF